MSFLKDFKEDLSQAVNGLVDENKVEETVVEEEAVAMEDAVDETVTEDFTLDVNELDMMINEEATEVAEEEASDMTFDTVTEDSEAVGTVEADEAVIEEDDLPSDEVAEITKGTSLVGNIESDGSINLYGKIKGDITCKGKLMVTGRVTGVSHAREIFANNAKIEGDVHSIGTIKIGNGSVIVGNVYATSAVIGGAVRGDIDVKGPVIVDGTAVVQGNIKSRSVQINNGAVIEGFCSQCYAEIDYKSLFEDTFNESM